MTKNEILDYVMNTPDNTNRMVLSDMLDSFSSGSSSGGLVVHVTLEAGASVFDKTWQEIHDAMEAGTSVLVVVPPAEEDEPSTVFPVIECNFAGSEYQGGGYLVVIRDSLAYGDTGQYVYQCNAASGYPAWSFG